MKTQKQIFTAKFILILPLSQDNSSHSEIDFKSPALKPEKTIPISSQNKQKHKIKNKLA